MAEIAIAEIEATSPTFAELMRSCLLRSGLARSSDAAQYVLGNPKAWLGLAYHTVLEKIAQLDTIDAVVERSATVLWEKAIKSLFQRVAGHALDHRFGEPQTWPGYHLALASVLIRAKEITGGGGSPPTCMRTSNAKSRLRNS